MSKFDFFDSSDALAGENYRSGASNNNGLVISIEHVASGKIVEFKAFLESFEDQFNSNWTETEVFGRMDMIQRF